MFDAGGARDGHYVWRLVQQPSDTQLRRGASGLLGQSGKWWQELAIGGMRCMMKDSGLNSAHLSD